MGLVCGKAELLTSSKEGEYLAIVIDDAYMKGYLSVLREVVGDITYITIRKYQEERDEGKFHLTILSPTEYTSKSNVIDIEGLAMKEFCFKLVGLGMGANDKAAAYFIVVQSEEIDQFRKELGLGNRDLHVTLGFYPEDIHDIDKSVSALIDFNNENGK